MKFVTLGAITRHGFDDKQTKLVDIDLTPDSPYWITPGDLLISRGNSPELVGYAVAYWGTPRTYAFPDLVTRARLNPEKGDARFFEWYLRTRDVRSYVARVAVGSSPSMKKVNHFAISHVPVPDIRLEDQQRIIFNISKVAHRLQESSQHLNEMRNKLSLVLSATANDLCRGRLTIKLPESVLMDTEQLDLLRRQHQLSMWKDEVGSAIDEMITPIRGAAKLVATKAELVDILRHLQNVAHRSPILVDDLRLAAGLLDVDEFYALLKQAFLTGEITESRESGQIFVELRR